MAHLLEYDSVLGRLEGGVSAGDGSITAAGEEHIRPKTEEEWMQVRNAAVAVTEAGNLLMMVPRAKDAEWMRISQAMIDTGAAAIKAAEAKDPDAVFDTGAEIVVATPGRMIDLIDRKAVSLEAIEHVVLDEADRMADMGFLPQVEWILRHTRRKHQTLLFSATLDGAIDAFVTKLELPAAAVTVVIDIKPGSSTNPINLRAHGVIPVAILSSESFDARTVDPASVCFGDADDPAAGLGHLDDPVAAADEEIDPQLLLQQSDLLADAGLRGMQHGRRAREIEALPGNLAEVAELVELHASSIAVGYRV